MKLNTEKPAQPGPPEPTTAQPSGQVISPTRTVPTPAEPARLPGTLPCDQPLSPTSGLGGVNDDGVFIPDYSSEDSTMDSSAGKVAPLPAQPAPLPAQTQPAPKKSTLKKVTTKPKGETVSAEDANAVSMSTRALPEGVGV